MHATDLSPHATQETLVLDAAAACIAETSLLDFTMAAISKKAGLSMGSVYKHIQSKEDVLVALGYQCTRQFGELAERLLQLPLPVVARLTAVLLVDARHYYPYPFGSQLISLLGNEALLRRASTGRVQQYVDCDMGVEKRFRACLVQAVADGELEAPGDRAERMIDEILLGVWALCVGQGQVSQHRTVRMLKTGSLRIHRRAPMLLALQRLLNTYPWQTPLSDEVLDEACAVLVSEGLR